VLVPARPSLLDIQGVKPTISLILRFNQPYGFARRRPSGRDLRPL
jgi:hypothetical protein